MPSPAQKHRERLHAAQHAASASAEPAGAAPRGTPYQLMLAKLAEDKRVLKGIQSIEQKVEVKRKRLPEYEAWINGVLSADQPVQDDVVATVMVWRIDTGDIAGALPIAAYMLEHGLKLPEPYQRDVATVLVEEVADLAARSPAAVTADQLLQVGHLTAGCDMPDEVRAKLYKASGLALRDTAPAQALEHLQRALQLNPRSGVKAEIGRLEKQLPPAT